MPSKGTKRAGRGVVRTSDNARGKRRRKQTGIVPPRPVPWLNASHLDVKRGNQDSQLKRALRDVGKLHGKVSLSMQVHADDCPWSVVLWPRASDCSADDPEMLDAVERRDTNCKCVPLIMYTGAMA